MFALRSGFGESVDQLGILVELEVRENGRVWVCGRV